MPIKAMIERAKAILAEWLSRFNKRGVVITLVAVFVLLVSISVVINLGKVRVGRIVKPLPSPSPTPVEEEIITPSSYATDSAVLAIEENIKTVEKDLLETDLYETGLNPPVLDMEVEFKE